MLGEEYTMHDARCASCEVRSARCRPIPEYGGTIMVLRPDPDPERSWVREGPPRGLFLVWQSFYYVCMEGGASQAFRARAGDVGGSCIMDWEGCRSR